MEYKEQQKKNVYLTRAEKILQNAKVNNASMGIAQKPV